MEYGFDEGVDLEQEGKWLEKRLEGKWLKEGLEKVRGVWLE